MSEYYNLEQEQHNDIKIKELLADMPPFVEDYIRAKKNENTSSRTRLTYAYELRAYFTYLINQPGLKGKSMRELTVACLNLFTDADIQEYLDYSRLHSDEDGRVVTNKEASMKRKISTLKSFYGYFYSIDAIEKNPMVKIKVPKLHEKVITTLEPEEIKRIYDAINQSADQSKQRKAAMEKVRDRDLAILTTLLGTGMRVSELVSLDLDDIDFMNAQFKVVRKGGNEAEIMFGPEVEDALRAYIEGGRRELWCDGADASALFLSMHHKRITVRAVENLVKKYAADAGILKKISPHKCRSTFGSYVYNQTGDIYMVADALGHSSVDTT